MYSVSENLQELEQEAEEAFKSYQEARLESPLQLLDVH